MSLALILVFFLFFLTLPLTAWAYFDPGFGGYLINTIISWALTGLAFISAAVIYFFRTVIGQRLMSFWQKHPRIVLLSVLCMMYLFLATAFFKTCSQIPNIRPRLSGVSIMDPRRMYQGYDLYNGKLINYKGRTLKQWSRHYLGVIDTNGDYYAQKDWRAPVWGRYTWDDRVIWEKHFPIHHALYLSPQGTLFTFTREARDYNNYKVNFDIILEFDKNGHELQRFSFFDHLKEFQHFHHPFQIDAALPVILQPFMSLWQKSFHHDIYDYFHINSFYIIPPNPLEDKNPALRPGNWLISIFHGSMVFILDKDTKKILWHAVANEVEGGLEGQHSASMLPSGNILIFDNGISRHASRILVIDPLTLKIKWQYAHKDFFSDSEGFVQALPNGNFLVTESRKEHAFELTPDKKIVWDFYDTAARDDDIYRMTSYPKKMIDGLLTKEIAH